MITINHSYATKSLHIHATEGFKNLDEILDIIGGYDIVLANELNGSAHYNLLVSGVTGKDLVYFLYNDQLEDLLKGLPVELKCEGPVEEFIDYQNENDVQFLKWLNRETDGQQKDA